LPKDTIPAYFLYRDAPEAQHHMRDRRLGWATSGIRVNVVRHLFRACAFECGIIAILWDVHEDAICVIAIILSLSFIRYKTKI